MRTTRFSETESGRILAREPRGFELESADAIYRYVKGRFDRGIREEQESLIPSVVDGCLWSLRDSNSPVCTTQMTLCCVGS
jgi:hypothetical protein